MSSERAGKRTPTAIIASARSHIARIIRWTAHLDGNAYEQDELVRYACERAFIALGEALRDLAASVDLNAVAPGGPWNYPVAFRNFLAHDYDDRAISPVVWRTITIDLPDLDMALASVEAALRSQKSSG